ncbi:hypothetical protein GC194_01940 [bacterium]|nr:hypothetical protein [bacterium]
MKLNKLLLTLSIAAPLALASCGGGDEPDANGNGSNNVAPEVKGCMDQASLNYNADATVDDGSCIYPTATESKGLFIKFTGTWCWACGDYGEQMVLNVEDAVGEKTVIIEAHITDEMSTPITDAWRQQWPSNSVPYFIGNSNKLGNDVTGEAKTAILNKTSTPAQFGFRSEISADNGTIFAGKAYVQALQDVVGEYYLGVYIIGHDLIYPQKADDHSAHPDWDFNYDSKTYTAFKHDFVLQGEVNNKAFGTMVFETKADKNQMATLEYAMTPSTNWAENRNLVMIVWKKNGAMYEYVDAAIME